MARPCVSGSTSSMTSISAWASVENSAIAVPSGITAVAKALMPLTEQIPDPSSAGIANATAEPGDDIEITAEMIEAGVRSYHSRDSRFMMDKDIVVDIFMSMLEARLKYVADRL